jgi:hypothetical protein
MNGEPLNTPMGQFLWLASAYGFLDRDVMIDALKAFTAIPNQGWASDLLERLHVPPDMDGE